MERGSRKPNKAGRRAASISPAKTGEPSPRRTGRAGRSVQKGRQGNALRQKKLGKPANIKGLRRRSRARRVGGGLAANASLLISAALVFVFVSLYMANALGDMMSNTEVPTISPIFGDVAPPQVHSGIIIRDEAVYRAQRDGILVFHQGEGVRVRPGSLVAQVQDGDGNYMREVQEGLVELEGRIVELQARRGVFDADIARMNQQLEAAVEAHLPRISMASFDNVHDMAGNARRLVSLRNQMLLTDDRSVRGLIDEREHFQGRLNSGASGIYSESSGVLSFSFDGLEDNLTFENMRSLLPEQVRQSAVASSSPRYMLAGEPAFRIVRSNNWYVALYIPIGAVGEWQAGQMRNVYLAWRGGWREIEVVVEELRPYIDTAFVLLRTTRFMADFLDVRDVGVRLSTTAMQDHIQIPAHVLRTMDAVRLPVEYISRLDTATPSVVREGLGGAPAQYIALDIFRRSGEYVYMLTDSNPLGLGDVVRHPQGGEAFIIAQANPIHGVFLLRFGFADFVDLHLGDSAGVIDGYIIVEAATNPRINPTSQIIVNPAGLQDGQRVL